jgi:hypothetical protein
MKLRSLLPLFAAVGLLHGADSRLLEIRQVYVLPMSGGLDQYLANRLTQNGRFMVVTDPAKADALLTDTVGVAFEDKYKELYPPPAPPEPPKDASKDAKKDDKSVMSMMTSGAGAPKTSAFSRGKGNVFLVDRASRSVIWSVYMPPKNRTTGEMNRTADRIVDKMDDAAEHREKALKKAAAPTPVVVVAKPAPAPAPVAVPTPAPAPVVVAPAKPAAPAPAPAPAK